MSKSSSMKASPDSASPVAAQNPSKATLDTRIGSASWLASIESKPSPSPYLMQRSVLTSEILVAFKENDFWTLRALNDRIKQPEQYLLWNLETMADYIEGGYFDGTYELKPEWKYFDEMNDYGLSSG